MDGAANFRREHLVEIFAALAEEECVARHARGVDHAVNGGEARPGLAHDPLYILHARNIALHAKHLGAMTFQAAQRLLLRGLRSRTADEHEPGLEVPGQVLGDDQSETAHSAVIR